MSNVYVIFYTMFLLFFSFFSFFFQARDLLAGSLENSGGPVGATEAKKILKLVKRGENYISLTSTTRGEDQCRVCR